EGNRGVSRRRRDRPCGGLAVSHRAQLGAGFSAAPHRSSPDLLVSRTPRIAAGEALDVFHDWQGFWARAKQLAPAGDWSTWVLRAGRGFGKTRTGAGRSARCSTQDDGLPWWRVPLPTQETTGLRVPAAFCVMSIRT